jgi:hypothetical protein
MTGYCPTIGSFLIGGTGLEVGISAEAARVKQTVADSLEHYLQPRLDQLIPAIKDAAESSRVLPGAIPVDQETAASAIDFAYLLPRFAPIPEVSADPDGEIAFDWIEDSGKMFSVSIDRSKRLAYAGWFGENSRVHGTEKLAESLPQEILRNLQRATR